MESVRSFLHENTILSGHDHLLDQHIAEFALGNLFFGGLLLYKIARPRTGIKRVAPVRRTSLDNVLALLLFVCLAAQVYVRYTSSNLLELLSVPFILGLLDLYLLIGSNTNRLHEVYNITLFFNLVALAFTEGLSDPRPYLSYIAWVQWWLLFIIPTFFITTTRFAEDIFDHYYYILASSISGLFFFDVCTPVALLTGLNVNYALHPPVGLLESPFYRIQAVVLLVFGCYLSGYVLTKMMHFIADCHYFYYPPADQSYQEYSVSSSPRSKKQR